MRHFWSICLSLISLTAFSGESQSSGPDAARLAQDIDQHIQEHLKSKGIPLGDQADDAEFLRRIYLDLHGVIPTFEQTSRFLKNENPNRRSKLIEELLADRRYGEYLGDIWQAHLISPLADDRRQRARIFRTWLADQFNSKSWDRIATDLLTATGKIEENPAVIYLIEGRNLRTVQDLADLTSRYFLGIRLSCAQCHDHPFVAWKQREFWGMAAFFSQIQTPGKSKVVYQVGVKDYLNVSLDSLKDGAADGFMSCPPTFLGGESIKAGFPMTNRAALAQWMTSGKNPFFAHAMVNRTWWRLFGRGMVQPMDDMHSGNLPSHPSLLDLLARQFVDSGFDHKFITRAMVMSQAYQRKSKMEYKDENQAVFFGRMPPKVLSAGQLYDSLITILGEPNRKGGMQGDTRAEFIQFFSDDGDPNPTSYRRGIPHLLRLMNSDQFARNIKDLASSLASSRHSPDEVSTEMFLKILSRYPSDGEQKIFRDSVLNPDLMQAPALDLAWALLMTAEFSLNH